MRSTHFSMAELNAKLTAFFAFGLFRVMIATGAHGVSGFEPQSNRSKSIRGGHIHQIVQDLRWSRISKPTMFSSSAIVALVVRYQRSLRQMPCGHVSLRRGLLQAGPRFSQLSLFLQAQVSHTPQQGGFSAPRGREQIG